MKKKKKKEKLEKKPGLREKNEYFENLKSFIK